MQQRVTIGPLLDGERIAGAGDHVQDVTAQLEPNAPGGGAGER